MGLEINSSEKNILNEITQIVSESIGIKFRETHKTGILRYIDKRAKELGISYEEFAVLAKNDSTEITSLINASTVNETYFFREEPQFLAAKKILSQKKEISIWSAACSSGEEIYSLKLLADSMNIKSHLFASDINTDKLQAVKDGAYDLKHSTREIDGKIFHSLLDEYSREEKIEFPSEIKNSINTAKINLVDLSSYPSCQSLGGKKFDMIFLRNVFIYFSMEDRYKILNHIAENFLADDGYVFVSLSETAQIEEKNISPQIEKICIGEVFLFHKKTSQEGE